MISEDLANLADWLAGHAARRQDIGPAATVHMAKVLMDMSRQARRLEDRAVSALVPEDDDGDD